MRAIDWRNKGLYFTNWQVRKNLQPPPDIEDTAYFVAYVSGCNELLEYRLKGMVDTSETAKEEQKIRITGSISAEILAHVTLKQRKMYQSLKAAADIDGSGGIRISNASPRGE